MKTLLAIAAAAALFVLLTPAAQAADFDEAGPSADNVDVVEAEAVEVEINVAQTGTITDVNIEMLIGQFVVPDPQTPSLLALTFEPPAGTEPAFSYTDNLTILLSHLGTTVLIYDGDGDTEEAYINAIFDDAAGDPHPSSGEVIGTYRPTEALGAFNGLELAGLWTLTIFDDTDFDGDGTDLLAWRIFGTTDETPTGGEIPEPASAALLAIAGAALLRRRGRRAA